VGVAGAGYLVQRADLAASGSALTATGLAVERLGNREARRRMRRQRQENRAELFAARQLTRDVAQELTQAQTALDELRARVETLSLRLAAQETTAQEAEVREGSGTDPVDLLLPPLPVTGALSPDPAATEDSAPAETQPSVMPSSAFPSVSRIPAEPRVSTQPTPAFVSDWFTPEPETRQIPRIRPEAGVFAGLEVPQALPAVPPGPREPISGSIPLLVDQAPAKELPSSWDETDALVYAALEAVDVDELTRVLEHRDGHPGSDSGPQRRLVPPESGAGVNLVVAGAHTGGYSAALPVRGRHSA
jgi:hypothetical protein